jgi:hypothetical protein
MVESEEGGVNRLPSRLGEFDRQIETHAPAPSTYPDSLGTDHLFPFIGIQHQIDLGLSFEETLEVLFLEENLAGILDVGVRFPKEVVVTEIAVIAVNAEELPGFLGIAR